MYKNETNKKSSFLHFGLQIKAKVDAFLSYVDHFSSLQVDNRQLFSKQTDNTKQST